MRSRLGIQIRCVWYNPHCCWYWDILSATPLPHDQWQLMNPTAIKFCFIQGTHILTRIIFEMNVTNTSKCWLNLARNANKKGNVAFLESQHIPMPFLKVHHYHNLTFLIINNYIPDQKQLLYNLFAIVLRVHKTC